MGSILGSPYFGKLPLLVGCEMFFASTGRISAAGPEEAEKPRSSENARLKFWATDENDLANLFF